MPQNEVALKPGASQIEVSVSEPRGFVGFVSVVIERKWRRFGSIQDRNGLRQNFDLPALPDWD